MNWLQKVRLRWRDLSRKRQLDGEMDAELRFHIEMPAAENARQRCSLTRRAKDRDFKETDSGNTPKVIQIKQPFDNLVFPGEDPVGRQIDCAGVKEIVGLIANVKNSGLSGETRPEGYVPYGQWEWRSCYLTVRARGDLATLAPLITHHVHAINPNQPVAEFRKMADYLDQSTAGPRFHSMLLSFFAATALFLAAVGIYGVMAVLVAQTDTGAGSHIEQPTLWSDSERSVDLSDCNNVAGRSGRYRVFGACAARFQGRSACRITL